MKERRVGGGETGTNLREVGREGERERKKSESRKKG